MMMSWSDSFSCSLVIETACCRLVLGGGPCHPAGHHDAGISAHLSTTAAATTTLRFKATIGRSQIQFQHIGHGHDINDVVLIAIERNPVDSSSFETQYHRHRTDLEFRANLLVDGAAHGVEGDRHAAAPVPHGAGQRNVFGGEVLTGVGGGMVEDRHPGPRHVENEGGGDGGGDPLLVLVAVEDAPRDVVGWVFFLGQQLEDGVRGDAIVEEISDAWWHTAYTYRASCRATK
mmetsp:Transcript_8410/g.23557  ORF Transcript_8410/g.23557 Transcript_8410/m.23557 type:complete len:232 (+) Transcript_8410:1452-2147(+)